MKHTNFSFSDAINLRKTIPMRDLNGILTGERDINRFWNNVEKTDYCWNWIGNKCYGYGRIGIAIGNGKQYLMRAHRFSYELHKGKIPNNLVIDHLCRNTLCVNPSHLEAITFGENILRGINPAANNNRKINCKHGHKLESGNIYIWEDRHGFVHRLCKKCRFIRYKKFSSYQKKRVMKEIWEEVK